ncbi:hypothetical protein BV898_15622 [Hypsibius exemplaris]|uniref:TIL domain-containing protein n=1 Tax=Hypsibius exemplaris TaxID=2072580 RepID=A0A9X6RKM2_HYPEX|nr:hypothetical protein BV898_15622 [Hypsibius exemplaris]
MERRGSRFLRLAIWAAMLAGLLLILSAPHHTVDGQSRACEFSGSMCPTGNKSLARCQRRCQMAKSQNDSRCTGSGRCVCGWDCSWEP